MTEMQFRWTDKGRRAVAARGIPIAEVEQALMAPGDMQIRHWIGDLLLVVVGMADSGPVLAVYTERLAGTKNLFKISAASYVSTATLDEYRRRILGQ